MREIPNFSGRRSVILHREGATTERLSRQMRLLGLEVGVQWTPLDVAHLPDLVVIDADQGWNGLLPWRDGNAPIPVVAMLGSEAPGRISWAVEQGACAIIAKPINASAVYPALALALDIHAERREMRNRLANLEERIRLRPVLYAAVQKIMASQCLDEDEAYRHLRRQAMRTRLTMEQVAASLLGGVDPLPEAV